MKNYGQILRAIKESPWLITEQGLDTILEIVHRHANDMKLDEEEIRLRLGGSGRGGNNPSEAGGGVGVIPLYGPIFPKANLMTELSGATSLETFQQQFRQMLANDKVETIVLDVDSPGGVSYMVPETAREIYESRGIKPIVAVASPFAASAAYFLASQADEFYMTESGHVGSIGVIAIHDDTTKIREKAGIERTFITAGKYKGELEKPLTEEAKEYIKHLAEDNYKMFVEGVARGRGTTAEDVMENYGEGRVLTATDALKVGMVDGVKTLDDVLGDLLGNGGKLSSAGSRLSNTARRVRIGNSYDRELEHSEPGTGPEPQPRIPPDDEDKDTWEKGERFHDPLQHQEAVMNREQLLAYASRLGIENADKLNDDDLATKVAESLNGVLDDRDEVTQALASAQQAREFAEQYPEQARELENLRSQRLQAEATTFANSFSRLKDGDGNETRFGLSIPVREKIEDVHLKLAQGNLLSSDLGELINLLASKSATVEFGEKGSSRQPDPTNLSDRRAVRTQFHEKVKELMEQDQLDRKAAITEASKRYPELAQAYLGS